MPNTVKPAFLVAAHVTKVAHVLAFTVFVLVLAWVLHFRGGAARLHSDDPNLIFNVHPLVMCMGFILVIGEGIMAYKTIPARKETQKLVHLMLQLVALCLGILGIYAAFKYHSANTMPDMLSLHSWLGMCTICLFGLQVLLPSSIATHLSLSLKSLVLVCLQWLFGFVNFWFLKASEPTRILLLPLHVSAGLAIFLLTVCTAETGFVQIDAAPGAESRLINFTGLFILLFAVAVSISVALPRVSI
ncbi:unnamed protein product [Musa hybrid cultivar]